MDSAGKRAKSQPMHGPPLQARVVAANRTVRTTCDDPGAHGNEQGAKQSKMNGGKNVDVGSGHGKGGRQAKPAEQGRCRQTQPADDPTGTGLEETTASRRSWPASRRAVQVGGGSAVVLATRKAGSDLPTCLPPTYRLCLSLYIPTPLICTNPI